jgi:hypothetical protein
MSKHGAKYVQIFKWIHGEHRQKSHKLMMNNVWRILAERKLEYNDDHGIEVATLNHVPVERREVNDQP